MQAVDDSSDALWVVFTPLILAGGDYSPVNFQKLMRAGRLTLNFETNCELNVNFELS